MKMLRKIAGTFVIAFLLAIITVFSSLAADVNIDEAAVSSYAESVIEELTGYSDDELAEAAAMYESYGYSGIADGFKSYLELKPSLGEYQQIGSPTLTTNEDGSIQVSVPVTFSSKTVQLILNIGADGYIADFSFRESANDGSGLWQKLKEASVNMVVGMGTVFLVLIFLCWIISLFGKISIVEKKLAFQKASGKKTEKLDVPAKNRPEIAEIVPNPASEEELQAVIAAAIAAYEADTGCEIEKQPALNNGINIKTYRRK